MARLAFVVGLLIGMCVTARAQWVLQKSNTTADLRGIHNVGRGVAWASGTHGTVLRTEDGGYVWQSCTVAPGAEHLDFRGIQAFDANTAIVMSSGKGDLSRLYKTTDGCHSWKLVFTNPYKDGFWDAMRFADPKHGFIFGDPVQVYGVLRFELEQTYDGGNSWKSWERYISELVSRTGDCGFAASNSSLVVEDRFSAIFASGCEGGARIFEVVNGRNPPGFCNCLPMPSEEEWNNELWVTTSSRGPFPDVESGGIFSIAGHGEIMAVGGDFKQADSASRVAAIWTFETPAGWTAPSTPPHGYRSAVAYDSASNTWITVGPNGTDISSDDGRNWRPLRPDPARHEAPDADRDWNALSLPFVVGPQGRIGKLNEDALKR